MRSNRSELIRALISPAILRGLVRKIYAVCMAKFVAKSPNSFLGGTSNATSGNVSENFNAPSFIAALTAALTAAAIFSLACKSFPPLKFENIFGEVSFIPARLLTVKNKCDLIGVKRMWRNWQTRRT